MNKREIPALGTRVYAKSATAICQAQEPGIVFERYEFGNHQGCSIIFKNGGNDGFSLDDFDHFMVFEGSVDENIKHYKFKNVTQVKQDYQRGMFSFKFPRTFEELEKKELHDTVEETQVHATAPMPDIHHFKL